MLTGPTLCGPAKVGIIALQAVGPSNKLWPQGVARPGSLLNCNASIKQACVVDNDVMLTGPAGHEIGYVFKQAAIQTFSVAVLCCFAYAADDDMCLQGAQQAWYGRLQAAWCNM